MPIQRGLKGDHGASIADFVMICPKHRNTCVYWRNHLQPLDWLLRGYWFPWSQFDSCARWSLGNMFTRKLLHGEWCFALVFAQHKKNKDAGGREQVVKKDSSDIIQLIGLTLSKLACLSSSNGTSFVHFMCMNYEVCFAISAAIMGTQAVLNSKCMSMLIQVSVTTDNNEFLKPTIYVILVTWIMFVAYWLRRLVAYVSSALHHSPHADLLQSFNLSVLLLECWWY